jgi:hypothetical protein
MSIADYNDLLVQVSEYTGRDDFTQMFPRAVSFAENKLNRRLRVASMETIVELITDSEGSVALPDDYLEMRELINSDKRILKMAAPEALDDYYGTASATPSRYTIINSTLFVIPATSASFTATYYAKLTPLTVTAPYTTNWLLDEAPQLYLYAVCAEVIGWAIANGREPDMNKLSAVNGLLNQEVNEFNKSDRDKRYSNAIVMPGGVHP